MKKVAYVTGSRADYGIVRNYLMYLNQDKNIDFEIIVTGSNLSDKYGSTIELIKNDKFKIAKEIDINLKDTSNKKVVNSMACCLNQFGDYFDNNKYDLIIILGDRYEMLSVAIAAAMNKIPILHLHGGELTYGNYDEFIRHSITKMSTYHFTSTEDYQKRVIQLGEKPNNVYNIGSLGCENCKKIDMKNVVTSLKKLPKKEYFVVLFHPETLTNTDVSKMSDNILEAINKFNNKYKFIFIGSNADTNSDYIRNKIKEYLDKNSNTEYYENLHPDSYHYLLKNSIALIGNSSSGIIEAPSLGTQTINIGERQRGRIKASSVIDVENNINEIENAIKLSITNKDKQQCDNPYYQPNASKKAYKYTIECLNKEKEIKEFYDLEV